LLVEMDGFDQNTGVILIAATNRPDVLDPALLRPGRFDRQIVVDRADFRGRQKILEVHARNKPLSKEVSLETLAKRTPGFSGADLENLLNEAALLAARKNKNIIEMNDCDEAIDRVMAKADDAFAGFDSVMATIDDAIPGLADGKTEELYEKVKSLREMADTFKQKSGKLMEETRQTLLDVSEVANSMTRKIDPAAAPAAAPPRRPQQKRP